ncbi:hypothetical protein R3P38DRAFT_3169528 [Favolaschia claudopus]|uniref:Uncharacterized protein n=1 Tax=Favolaschia claudopus TaxID=2862362 RepID=A0AAW0E108_9AGAR
MTQESHHQIILDTRGVGEGSGAIGAVLRPEAFQKRFKLPKLATPAALELTDSSSRRNGNCPLSQPSTFSSSPPPPPRRYDPELIFSGPRRLLQFPLFRIEWGPLRKLPRRTVDPDGWSADLPFVLEVVTETMSLSVYFNFDAVSGILVLAMELVGVGFEPVRYLARSDLILATFGFYPLVCAIQKLWRPKRRLSGCVSRLQRGVMPFLPQALVESHSLAGYRNYAEAGTMPVLCQGKPMPV